MTDTLSFLRLIHEADRALIPRVADALPDVAQAVDGISLRLDEGGRLFYVGAGTSGRLGALDAAELPPTFGIDPSLVVAVLAGGRDAMWQAVEGAEDDAEAGARDLVAAGMTGRDAVVGIAASGTTPYVAGALRRARHAGAFTVALVCRKVSPFALLADTLIAIDVGPEVLAESTRMAAGTAQKMVLNMMSTSVMAKRGLVYRGQMVAMRPTNAKLRDRAIRIVVRLLRKKPEEAKALLTRARWNLAVALVSGKWDVGVPEARARLKKKNGSVSRAMEERI